MITILPADREIIEVHTSENGLIRHLPDIAVCLEMTSARGETVREIAAHAQKLGRKIDFIDAPVSGGIPGRKAGP
jgi:3-hydroxyisobutyrate dehydrogenase-like beta-hydroxyacid dehydrogenase